MNSKTIKSIIGIVIFVVLIIVIYFIKNNNSYDSSFDAEVKNIIMYANHEWTVDNSSGEITEKTYSNCKNGCNNKMKDLESRSSLHYYVHLDNRGFIKKIFITDGEYQYSFVTEEQIKSTNIISEVDSKIKKVSELSKDKVFYIENSEVHYN